MNLNLWQILIVFLIITFSMVLHELAHGYAAYFLGDTTAKDEGRLSLNPLKHLDPVMSVAVPLMLFIAGGPVFGGAKPVPIDTRNLKGGAWGFALVALAGPLMNFVLAFLAFLIGNAVGAFDAGGSDLLYFIFTETVYANLGFCVFNLIPIPPLDGSRLLYAISPDSVRDLMEKLESTIGIFLVMILVVVFGTQLSEFTSSVINAIIRFFYMFVS